MFSPISVAKSPRIDPGGASTGFVGPIIVRQQVIASSPRDPRHHDGPAGDEVDELAEERLLAVLAVVLLGRRRAGS